MRQYHLNNIHFYYYYYYYYYYMGVNITFYNILFCDAFYIYQYHYTYY